MKNAALILLLIALTIAGYWLYQSTGDCDCTNTANKITLENKALVLENQRIKELIRKQQDQKDSLQQLATEERQKVTDMRKTQHEKVQAIDHFSNDELLNFFAELKADGAKNWE